MISKQKNKISPQDAWDLIKYYDNGRQIEFVRDVLGRKPWHMQAEIIQACFKYKVVAVKSCNAAGKSDLASDVALAFLTLKPGSIVITTAPTWRQVKDVLWRYIRDKYAKAPIKLSDKQCNQVGLDLAEDWFAVGLSTKDAEKFFGYHADDILVIVDEASGVEEEIYIGVDAVTPNVNAHVLMIGNPTNPEGRFYKAFQDPLVKKFTISVFDTPNFTANNIRNLQDLLAIFTPPLGIDALEHITNIQKSLLMPIPALISPETVYRRYMQWGDEHPMWEALIMGEFPSQSSTALIPLALIMKSQQVWQQIVDSTNDPSLMIKPEWNISIDGKPEYGIDIARFGDDKNVMYQKKGGFIDKASSWSKVDTAITTDRIIDSLSATEWIGTLRIDDTGVGGGVTDQLRRRKQDMNGKYPYTVVPINFGAGTSNPSKYFNLRAEMFDNLAQMFKDHKIAIPADDDDLAYELAAIRVKYVGKENNIIQIESKQQLKDRLKRSPDKADALALACIKSSDDKWKTDDSLYLRDEHHKPITSSVDQRY